MRQRAPSPRSVMLHLPLAWCGSPHAAHPVLCDPVQTLRTVDPGHISSYLAAVGSRAALFPPFCDDAGMAPWVDVVVILQRPATPAEAPANTSTPHKQCGSMPSIATLSAVVNAASAAVVEVSLSTMLVDVVSDAPALTAVFAAGPKQGSTLPSAQLWHSLPSSWLGTSGSGDGVPPSRLAVTVVPAADSTAIWHRTAAAVHGSAEIVPAAAPPSRVVVADGTAAAPGVAPDTPQAPALPASASPSTSPPLHVVIAPPPPVPLTEHRLHNHEHEHHAPKVAAGDVIVTMFVTMAAPPAGSQKVWMLPRATCAWAALRTISSCVCVYVRVHDCCCSFTSRGTPCVR